MTEILEWLLNLIVLEGSTWTGRINAGAVVLVLVLHRVENLFKWIARHITIRIGNCFRWNGSHMPPMAGSMFEDMAAVVFFLLTCFFSVQWLNTLGRGT